MKGVNSIAKSGKRRGGFSMIELVIVIVIIGIIAAIAIPRMSRGSAAAADSAVAQNLSILRNGIDLYQTEHNGVFPTAVGSVTVADLLTKYSNLGGTTVSDTKTSTCIYGPYVRAIPTMTVGSLKGEATIGASATAWLYDDATGAVTANASGSDSAGKAYSSY